MPDLRAKTLDPTKIATADADGFMPFEPDQAQQARFEQNLQAFNDYAPWLTSKLSSLKATKTQLLTNSDGDFDISFKGEKFFRGGSRKWALDRVDNFEKKPLTRRLLCAPVDTENLDDVSNSAIFHLVKRAVKEHDIKFAVGPLDPTCYHMVILGVGLADHLPLLIERTDCRNLILFEPNIEFLYHSLFTFDWVQLFKDYDIPGKRIVILNEQVSTKIALRTRDAIRVMGPHFADGTFVFQTYPNSLLERASQEIFADVALLISGMGFLEDEFDMVRNAHNNFQNFTGQYYQKRSEIAYIPAFVIGSGPSLDMDLDFLKANQDRAVIISCGTSMRILLHNGIRPDIHVEMENTRLIPKLLENVSGDYDLSDITLVAANTVDPEIQKLFKKVVFFVRPSLTSSKIFDLGKDAIIEFPSPTVANLGFSLACELGFQSVYLFGVDLGARDPHIHHATDVIYNTGEFGPANVTAEEISTSMASNFGGQVYSEYVYLWSRDMIQNKAQCHKGRRQFFNCSDGVRIDGITPKLSTMVKLKEQPEKKANLEAILTDFPEYSQAHFAKSWQAPRLRNNLRLLRNKLLACCDQPPIDDMESEDETKSSYIAEETLSLRPGSETDQLASPKTKAQGPEVNNLTLKPRPVAEGDLDFLVDITRHLIPRNDDASTEQYLFRGSMLMMMTAINYYTARILKGETRDVLVQIAREETVKQILDIADHILQFYDWMDGEVDTPPSVGAYRDLSS